MDFNQKTFRKCGSHYSDIGVLDGVQVKVGESYQPPRKVTLPVGFHQKDLSEALSLTYDFSLEIEIIAKADKLKAKQLQEDEEKEERAKEAACSDAQTASSTATTIPNAIFTSVGTDILLPTAAAEGGHRRNDSLGKNTFDLSDFEANGSNPFELVELQTINDLDVLKSVLQSVSPPQPGSDVTNSVAMTSDEKLTNVTSSGSSLLSQSTHPQPYNYLTNQTPIASTEQFTSSSLNKKLSKSVPELSSDQLVDVSGHNNNKLQPEQVSSTSRSVSPPSALFVPSQLNSNPSIGYGIPAQPFSYLHAVPNSFPSPSTVPQTNSVLVDVSSARPVDQASQQIPQLNTSSSSGTTASTSFPTAGPNTQSTSNIKLPPLRRPPPIPPRPSSHSGFKNIDSTYNGNQGVGRESALANPTEPTGETSTATTNQDMTRLFRRAESDLTPANHSLIQRQHAQKRNKSKMLQENSRRHSTPLPPISSPAPPPTLPGQQSSLPDPMPVLTDSEKTLVNYIAIMGFPVPRVARAVQRLGEKDREIIDFLVAVEELCQSRFQGDDVEIAMTLNDYDAEKALEFLTLSETFKELGFEELYIQEALRAANNDRDMALDYLMSISAT